MNEAKFQHSRYPQANGLYMVLSNYSNQWRWVGSKLSFQGMVCHRYRTSTHLFQFFLKVCFMQREFQQENVLGQFPRSRLWDGDFWERDLLRQWSRQNPVQKGHWRKQDKGRGQSKAKMWSCLESQPDVTGSSGVWKAPQSLPNLGRIWGMGNQPTWEDQEEHQQCLQEVLIVVNC